MNIIRRVVPETQSFWNRAAKITGVFYCLLINHSNRRKEQENMGTA